MRAIELLGKRFGRLTVVALASGSPRRWVCDCDCGGRTIAFAGLLRKGDNKTCGKCQHLNTRHGRVGTPEYISWMSMKARCNNPGAKDYDKYGGRGIKVCKRWHQFKNFYADMGSRPLGTSLDRRNNDKGYSKSNCRWGTTFQQRHNQRRNELPARAGRPPRHRRIHKLAKGKLQNGKRKQGKRKQQARKRTRR